MQYTVTQNNPLTKTVYRLTLEGDTRAITRPGQFVQVAVPGCYLRRPLSVFDWSPAENGSMYFARGALFVILAGSVMMSGYMVVTAALSAEIRDRTPQDRAGHFQGIRMIFAVMLPMLIGPFIGAAVIRGNAQTYVDLGTTKTVPTPAIFLAAGATLLLVLIPVLLLRRRENACRAGGFPPRRPEVWQTGWSRSHLLSHRFAQQPAGFENQNQDEDGERQHILIFGAENAAGERAQKTGAKHLDQPQQHAAKHRSRNFANTAEHRRSKGFHP